MHEIPFFTDPPENVRLILTRRAQKATITCTAEACPEPSFKIFLNETVLVISDKTYIIPEVNNSHVGNYTCVVMNVLGKASSVSEYLSFERKISLQFSTKCLIFKNNSS